MRYRFRDARSGEITDSLNRHKIGYYVPAGRKPSTRYFDLEINGELPPGVLSELNESCMVFRQVSRETWMYTGEPDKFIKSQQKLLHSPL